MADPSAVLTRTAPGDAARVTRDPEKRPARGGSGLFGLYRALGAGGVGEGSPPAAEATPALSRAARLLAPPAVQPVTTPPPSQAAPAPAAPVVVPALPAGSKGAPHPAPAPAEPVVPPAQKPGSTAKTENAEPTATPPLDTSAQAAAGSAPPAEPVAGKETPPVTAERQIAPRRRQRTRRTVEPTAVLDGLDERLAAARTRKQLKRRVRGQDYEQVTVILDRPLYLELDRRLGLLSAQSGGVKLSRSMFVRALLRRFMEDGAGLSFDGLFTPDPRSAEELEVLEAALVERLAH